MAQFLRWVAERPRAYADVMEAWRTSCPRLTVWEDANEQGFIERRREAGQGEFISVSAAGQEHLQRHR